MIEVLIAAAIGSIIALVLGGMIASMGKGQKLLSDRMQADNFTEELRAALSSRETCKASFGGLILQPIADQRTDVPFLKNATGDEIYKKNVLYANAYVIESMYITRSASDVSTFEDVGTFRIQLRTTQNTANTASGTCAPGDATCTTPNSVFREMKMKFQLKPDNSIEECLALAKMSDGIWQRVSKNSDDIFFEYSMKGGKVGIGVSEPQTLLHVKGASDSGIVTFERADKVLHFDPNNNGSNQNAQIKSDLNMGLQLMVNSTRGNLGTAAISITPQGKVGIGEANPQHPLTVATTDYQFGIGISILPSKHVTSKRSAIALDNWLVHQDTMGDGIKDFSIYQISQEKHRLTIKPTGEVGIGTANPSALLHVEKSQPVGRMATKLINSNTGPGSRSASMNFAGSTAGSQWEIGNDFERNGTSSFYIFDIVDVTIPRLYIGPTGNAGIGTSNPQAKLEVAGGIRAGSQSAVTVCNASTEGTQRYNFNTHAPEFCSCPVTVPATPCGWMGSQPLAPRCQVRTRTSTGNPSRVCCDPNEVVMGWAAPMDSGSSAFRFANTNCGDAIDIGRGNSFQLMCCL